MKKNTQKIKIALGVLVFVGMISFVSIVNADDATTTSTSTDTGTATTTDTTTTTSTSTNDGTATTTETVLNENFIIRDGSTVIFNGAVPLPNAGTVSIADKNGNAHSINSRSVLAILNSIANSNNTFTISDLEYYNSYGSFYLKCLTPQGASAKCDNWQYAVGNSTPFTGIDQTILSGGETIGIYFGSQHRVQFDKTTISAGDSVVATAQSYNYTNDTWSPLSSVTIGITVPNPNDAWNPTVVSTAPVSQDGTAKITITKAGAYTAGIVEDYYFPSYTLQVTTTPEVQSTGGVAQMSPATSTAFSVARAFGYLQSVQANDGSFGGSDMYTDWAGIAYGAGNISGTSTDALVSYLTSHATLSSNLTDNERRAMALLSLGKNPYSFNGVNYVDVITKSFDGIQFGDSSLVNDDIFALIPLSASGYTATDTMISKDVAFIISKQGSDGSWNQSVDMTSAAVQALSQYKLISGVSDSLAKAGVYLQNSQKDTGGWENISASSWAIGAMNTLGAQWVKNDKDTNEYLGEQQVSDGAVLPITQTMQNRIWATSYAIPASLGKSWSSIMHAVSKPEIVVIPTSTSTSTSTSMATSTISATSTSTSTLVKNKVATQTETKLVTQKETSVSATHTEFNPGLSANVLQSQTDIPENKAPVNSGSNSKFEIFKSWIKKLLSFF
ncbi:MAG: hypothetical protein WCO65_01950 [bacterium]